jgi:peroxiredoxin
MGMLQVGEHTPAFTLRDVDGKSHALAARSSPLTLAVFFKTTCPTCHYAWQYYQRMHETYKNSGLSVLGISQHDAERTREYRNQYDATFPHLLDEGFTVSRAYDPAFVPTGFLIDTQGKIIETIESWNSQRVNDVSKHIAQELGVPAQHIVTPQDNAVENKMG